MSLLNKQNIKQLALEAAKTENPDKTRISGDFISQLEDVVACVTIQMVRSQPIKGMTMKDTDWGHNVVQNGKRCFTKLEPSDYLRGS